MTRLVLHVSRAALARAGLLAKAEGDIRNNPKLVQRKVVDKRGRITTRYVDPSAPDPGEQAGLFGDAEETMHVANEAQPRPSDTYIGEKASAGHALSQARATLDALPTAYARAQVGPYLRDAERALENGRYEEVRRLARQAQDLAAKVRDQDEPIPNPADAPAATPSRQEAMKFAQDTYLAIANRPPEVDDEAYARRAHAGELIAAAIMADHHDEGPARVMELAHQARAVVGLDEAQEGPEADEGEEFQPAGEGELREARDALAAQLERDPVFTRVRKERPQQIAPTLNGLYQDMTTHGGWLYKHHPRLAERILSGQHNTILDDLHAHFAPAEPEETITGTRAMGNRMAQAELDFIDTLAELAGISHEEAGRAMRTFVKEKVAKLEPSIGRYKVKHGAFLEPDAIRRAAAAAEPEPEPEPEPAPAVQAPVLAAAPTDPEVREAARKVLGNRAEQDLDALVKGMKGRKGTFMRHGTGPYSGAPDTEQEGTLYPADDPVLAIYKDPGRGNAYKWAVVHVPTGLGMTNAPSKKAAQRVVAANLALGRDTLAFTDAKAPENRERISTSAKATGRAQNPHEHVSDADIDAHLMSGADPVAELAANEPAAKEPAVRKARILKRYATANGRRFARVQVDGHPDPVDVIVRPGRSDSEITSAMDIQRMATLVARDGLSRAKAYNAIMADQL